MRSVGAIGTTAAEQHETVYRVHSKTQLVQLQSNFAQNHIACQEHMKACAVWTISGLKESAKPRDNNSLWQLRPKSLTWVETRK